MHCNDAAVAVARLDDMGIAPFLISSSVIIAAAQRLVRRICLGSKEPVTYPLQMFRDLGIAPGFFDGVNIHRGRGCDRCNNSGYAGRMAIIEAMTMSDEIRKMIINRSSAMEIGNLAISQGMKTLRMVALEKVREGAPPSNKCSSSRPTPPSPMLFSTHRCLKISLPAAGVRPLAGKDLAVEPC